MPHCLILILVIAGLVAAAAGNTLPAHAAGPAAAERRRECKVDVLLAVDLDEEGGDVADLLPDADVALPDQDARVVHRLREAELEDLGLKPTLHDLCGGQSEDVIELLLVLGEEAKLHHPAEEGAALEHARFALVLQREQVAR